MSAALYYAPLKSWNAVPFPASPCRSPAIARADSLFPCAPQEDRDDAPPCLTVHHRTCTARHSRSGQRPGLRPERDWLLRARPWVRRHRRGLRRRVDALLEPRRHAEEERAQFPGGCGDHQAERIVHPRHQLPALRGECPNGSRPAPLPELPDRQDGIRDRAVCAVRPDVAVGR